MNGQVFMHVTHAGYDLGAILILEGVACVRSGQSDPLNNGPVHECSNRGSSHVRKIE